MTTKREEPPKKISIASGLILRSKKEERARDHSGHFQEYVFNQTLAPFQMEWHEMFMEGHRSPDSTFADLLILAPRGHAKTTNCEGFALWKIWQDNQNLIQFICATLDKATERLGKIEDVIRNNRRFRELAGELYPGKDPDYTWTSRAMEVLRDRSAIWEEEGGAERDPSFAAFGITTNVEGGRATLQIFDDIMGEETAQSESERARIARKYWMSFVPMLKPSGQRIIIGTRYHYDDIYANLMPVLDDEGLYTSEYVTPVTEEVEAIIAGG